MSYPPDAETSARIARLLLEWFAHHARDLPWRRERTPYRVWLAEVMLQQTQVDTVIPYYGRFLSRFPTVQALADAPREDVLKVWEGLGYYARARNLHASAQRVVGEHSGQIPDTPEGLLRLPGIGRYIAGAVASIAFGQPTVAVDGNARRVLCRVFAVQDDVAQPRTRRGLEALAESLLPSDQAGAFNEALMELGATVCLPRMPHCQDCPLRDDCQGFGQGRPEALPVRRPRPRVPHYDVTAAVTTRPDGRVLVAQRKVDDMLGGLWEFPGGKREADETLPACLIREMREELGIGVEVGPLLTTVRHAYTHFRITLHAFLCGLVSGEPRCLDCAAFRWVQVGDLEALPMSVADRKVAQALMTSSFGAPGLQ